MTSRVSLKASSSIRGITYFKNALLSSNVGLVFTSINQGLRSSSIIKS